MRSPNVLGHLLLGLAVLAAPAVARELTVTRIAPQCIGFAFSGTDRVDAIRAAEDGLYVATNVGLYLVDPHTRKTLRSRELPNKSYSLAVSPEALYLGERATPQVQVLDRTTFQTLRTIDLPTLDHTYSFPQDVAVSGDHLFVATFQKVIEVSAKTGALEKVLPMSESGPRTDVWGLAVDGQFLYYTWPSGGVYRYDIAAGATEHFERGSYQAGNGMVFGLPECAKGISVSGRHAYVSDEWHGIAVYDKASGALERYIDFPEGTGCMMWTQMNAAHDGVIEIENAVIPLPADR